MNSATLSLLTFTTSDVCHFLPIIFKVCRSNWKTNTTRAHVPIPCLWKPLGTKFQALTYSTVTSETDRDTKNKLVYRLMQAQLCMYLSLPSLNIFVKILGRKEKWSIYLNLSMWLKLILCVTKCSHIQIRNVIKCVIIISQKQFSRYLLYILHCILQILIEITNIPDPTFVKCLTA